MRFRHIHSGRLGSDCHPLKHPLSDNVPSKRDDYLHNKLQKQSGPYTQDPGSEHWAHRAHRYRQVELGETQLEDE